MLTDFNQIWSISTDFRVQCRISNFTTAWSVLRLQMEELTPKWRVDANILNKQLRTADKARSSSLGIGRGAKNSTTLRNVTASGLD
jgi:hypothetical protein